MKTVASRVERTGVQKTCMTLGLFFMLAGVIGFVMPGFIGMHLSATHNWIHLISGALAFGAGSAVDPRKAFIFAVTFGLVYGGLGLAGFILGSPGYPGVGNMEADANLLRIVPNVFEAGTMDHIIHIALSAVFLSSAYLWKKDRASADKSIVDVQRRKEPVFTLNTTGSNVGTDLHRSELGRNDIDRGIDRDRHQNFENRL